MAKTKKTAPKKAAAKKTASSTPARISPKHRKLLTPDVASAIMKGVHSVLAKNGLAGKVHPIIGFTEDVNSLLHDCPCAPTEHEVWKLGDDNRLHCMCE